MEPIWKNMVWHFLHFCYFFHKILASSQPGFEFWILVKIHEIICLTFEFEFQYPVHSERELKKLYFTNSHKMELAYFIMFFGAEALAISLDRDVILHAVRNLGRDK